MHSLSLGATDLSRASSVVVVAFCLVVGSCGTRTPPLTPEGSQVIVNQNDPPSSYEEIGLVVGNDGYGCEGKGARGTLEGAMNRLRNRAAAMGADYVRIELAHPPHFDGTCRQLRYVLSGTAFTSHPKKRDVGFGTCFAVRPDGVILTAGHVVEDAESIEVALEGAEFLPARIVASHEDADIAVVAVDAATPNYLRLAPEGSLSLGDWVFTIGYPVIDLLGKDPKFTDGSVSALQVVESEEKGWMQMTTPVQPGNSGGPLIDSFGRVVGITVASARAKAFLDLTGSLPQGINFAVHSYLAADLFEAPSVPPPTAAQQGADGGAPTTLRVAEPDRRTVVEQAKASVCAIKSKKPPRYRAPDLVLDE